MNINNWRVLGIDTSQQRTGWGIIQGFEFESCGVIEPPKEFKKLRQGDSDWSYVLQWFYNSITDLMEKSNCDKKLNLVSMEDLHIRHLSTAKSMMQFQAAAKLAVVNFDRFIPINLVHNKTVKSMFKIIDRKNNIPNSIIKKAKENRVKEVKIQMVDKINEMYNLGLTYKENDEADAIANALTLLVIFGKELYESEKKE